MELFNMSDLKICTCIVTLIFFTLFLKNLSHEIRSVKAGYHEKRSRVFGLLLTFLAFLVGVISLFAIDPQMPCVADNNPSDEYIELVSPSGVDLYYTLDDTLPDKKSTKYHDEIHVLHTSELRVVAIDIFGCRSNELQTTIVSENDDVLVTDSVELVWVSKQEGHSDDLVDGNDKITGDTGANMYSVNSTSTANNEETQIVSPIPPMEANSENDDDKIISEEESIDGSIISDEPKLLDTNWDDAFSVEISDYQFVFEHGKCYDDDLIFYYDRGIAGHLELSREFSQEVVRFAIWDKEKDEKQEVEFYINDEYCFIVKLPDDLADDCEYSLYVEVIGESENVLGCDDTAIILENVPTESASGTDYNGENEVIFSIEDYAEML